MEELFELNKYFPFVIIDPIVRNYIRHHLEHLQKCVENNLYSSAYPHLHIIYMSFVYIQLLRIYREKEKEFKLCWAGMPDQENKFMKKPDSPFSFSEIKEKSIFRFFRIIGFDDSTISNFSSVVNGRNDVLHANGIIGCSSESEFSIELSKYLRLMKSLKTMQLPFIQSTYERLVCNFDNDYLVTPDDIEISFGTFSLAEMELLIVNKNDVISKYIKENII